ncbi:TSUP family transporter [Nocardia sp. alder85J]|uniref:TSUP family transporter n=1 Tax=Nocardia sp. alder85J TaxID=2862949 RepID=UPI001CD76A16|nr:TSUP family transporter [Nocardia sp. alder85J]MCX4092838.1 TSUP family transporter [Nocardia sp. alder85J]
MSVADWAALLAAATAAGWVDAVVGGGGLIILPTLLLVAPTLAPQTALGTNKIAALSGTSAATVTFARRVPLRLPLLLPAAALAAAAAAAGSAAVGLIDRRWFIPIVMVVLIGVAIFVTLRPSIGRAVTATKPPTRRRVALVVGLAAGLIGCYDGLLGPGTGTFLIITFATLLGTEFVRAAAMAKVINCGSNLGALLYLAATGHVLWGLGLAMGMANIAGAVVGSRMALARGAGFVRTVLLVVVTGMVLRLGWQQFL